MARTVFPFNTFTVPSGDPLSGGYALIRLNNDVQSSEGLLCGGLVIRVDLDDNGIMISAPQVWPNDELLPSGSVYILTAYTVNGELVLDNVSVSVASPQALGFGLAFGVSFGS